MIGDDDTPGISRIGTPAVGGGDAEASAMGVGENGTASSEPKEEGSEAGSDATLVNKAPSAGVLPVDVRQRLRKLERLEPKYSGNI